MLLFSDIPVRQTIVSGILLHDSITSQRKCIWHDHFLSVYFKLDAYMAHWYVFQSLQSLNRRVVQWKPAEIYHVNATTARAISETEIAGSKKCKGFYLIYFRINVKWLKCIRLMVLFTSWVPSLKLYTYYLSQERLLSLYFGRIHPKILEFQFFFFLSHVAGVQGKHLSIEVFRLVTSDFFSVSERHRRSAYELGA